RPDPPALTLFPYTTLFRSQRQSISVAGAVLRPDELSAVPAVAQQRLQPIGAGVQVLGDVVAAVAQPMLVRRPPGREDIVADPAADRKSTRLNSSHVKISYA